MFEVIITSQFIIRVYEKIIVEDADCTDIIGVYEFVVTETQPAYVAVDYECTPRMAALQEVWAKK